MDVLEARTKGSVFHEGTVTCMARIVDITASTETNLTQSTVSSITYTVYLVDDSNPDSPTAITNHTNVSLTVANVIYNTLQTPATWTADTTGYNFRHTVPISTNAAFTTAGRKYWIVYTITPTSGQKFPLGFEVMCV